MVGGCVSEGKIIYQILTESFRRRRAVETADKRREEVIFVTNSDKRDARQHDALKGPCLDCSNVDLKKK